MSGPLQMVVQLPLADRHPNETERVAHGALEEALAEGFEVGGFGDFDGSEAGEGKANLFIYNIPPARWDEALAFAVAELRRRGLADGALIARGVLSSDEEDAEFEQKVVWPPGFRGSFSTF
ncbi:MAG: hypothetical protein U0840_01860 [Gemmataceae bacterium]